MKSIKKIILESLLVGLTSINLLQAAKKPRTEVIFNFGIHSGINPQTPSYTFPTGLSLTPVHPDDLAIYPEPVLSQEVPNPNGGGFLQDNDSFGLSVNPFRVKYLNTLRLGYTVNNVSHIQERRDMPILINGTQPIDSFTYQKFTASTPKHELTASLRFPFHTFSDNKDLGLDLGVGKTSSYNIEAEQGWNRFGRDEPFRRIKGKNNGLNKSHAKLYYTYYNEEFDGYFGFGINLGYEQYKSKVDWGNEAGRRDFSYKGLTLDALLSVRF